MCLVGALQQIVYLWLQLSKKDILYVILEFPTLDFHQETDFSGQPPSNNLVNVLLQYIIIIY